MSFPKAFGKAKTEQNMTSNLTKFGELISRHNMTSKLPHACNLDIFWSTTIGLQLFRMKQLTSISELVLLHRITKATENTYFFCVYSIDLY